jgi:hypothetical protein
VTVFSSETAKPCGGSSGAIRRKAGGILAEAPALLTDTSSEDFMSAICNRTARAALGCALALLALVSTNAASSELQERGMTVGAHLATAHLGDHGAPREGWQNVNPGLYVRLANGITAGAYWNSERRTSAYAGWTLATSDDRWALTVGAVTGYGGVKPLLAPSVRIGLTKAVSVRLTLLAAPKASPAIHVSAERRF